MNILIKLLLTIVIIAWASHPYFDSSNSQNIVNEILSIAGLEILVVILSFFVLVAFYCKTLQKCLTLIQPKNRKAKPFSVWYMFLLPMNFVEDFFIIINVSNSIEAEAKENIKLLAIKDYGMITGIGWCIAQILSFIPNYIGYAAAIASFALVIFHWLFIHRINQLLSK